MELHCTTAIDQPYADTAPVFAGGPQAWLPEVEAAPEAWTAEIGIGDGDGRISRRVLVRAGTAQPFGYGLLVPVEWRALEHAERYPTLAGGLRLEPEGPAGCRLRLDAQYRPPAGRLGAAIDRAVLHHVAEASCAEFVERVAERLRRGAVFASRFGPEQP